MDTDTDMRRLMSKKVRLRILPENQDGCYNIKLFHNLMRANYLLGVFCSLLRAKHLGRISFHFMAKTFKYASKMTSLLVKTSTPDKNNKKRGNDRKIRKSVACAVGRLLLTASSSSIQKKCLYKKSDTHFNHVADCMSQAYRFAKEEVQRQEELQNPAEALKKKAKRKRAPSVSEPDPKERKYIENYVKTKHPTLFPDDKNASVALKTKKKRRGICKVTPTKIVNKR